MQHSTQTEHRVVSKFFENDEKASSLIASAARDAAPVSNELKQVNKSLLGIIETSMQEGYDAVRVKDADGEWRYLKMTENRSALSCRLEHLAKAFDRLTAHDLTMVRINSDGRLRLPLEVIKSALIKNLRSNPDLFTGTHYVTVDKRPLVKKRLAHDPDDEGEKAVRLVDADAETQKLARRQLELKGEKAKFDLGKKKARQDATVLRAGIDPRAIREIVERSEAGGMSLQRVSTDGVRKKLITVERRVTPVVNVTTLDSKGLLEVILSKTLNGLEDTYGSEPTAYIQCEVRERFLRMCEDCIKCYKRDNSTTVSTIGVHDVRRSKRDQALGVAKSIREKIGGMKPRRGVKPTASR